MGSKKSRVPHPPPDGCTGNSFVVWCFSRHFAKATISLFMPAFGAFSSRLVDREYALRSEGLLLCPQGDKSQSAFLFTYAQQQVNYMLGDAGRSYVVGFGKDPPNMPFHKW